jgi:anti-anti-sigma factor
MTTSDTTVRTRAEVAVIDLAGDIDAHAEASLEAAWGEAMSSSPAAVTLNFHHAGYINSTGIALIVGMLAKARARGIPLSAYGLTPHYREIFEITRLADFMAIEADEESAVQGADHDRAAGGADHNRAGGAGGSTT